MKSSVSIFKPLFFGKNSFEKSCSVQKMFKKSDVIFNILKSMCYNRLCVDMFFLCVIKMTLCKKYHPLKTLAIPCPFPSVLVPFFLFLEIYCNTRLNVFIFLLRFFSWVNYYKKIAPLFLPACGKGFFFENKSLTENSFEKKNYYGWVIYSWLNC